jgi:GNAT superfamily N-acetyltransferase
MLAVINDSAAAYREVIPADCWHEPYMPAEELAHEIAAGVSFWAYIEDGAVAGVMGIQDRGEVTLIRHAYVKTDARRGGIGGELLKWLLAMTKKPVLVGTWAAASWAVRFYEKHGFRPVTPEEKDRLLRRFWKISDRQVETSVVLELMR